MRFFKSTTVLSEAVLNMLYGPSLYRVLSTSYAKIRGERVHDQGL